MRHIKAAVNVLTVVVTPKDDATLTKSERGECDRDYAKVSIN